MDCSPLVVLVISTLVGWRLCSLLLRGGIAPVRSVRTWLAIGERSSLLYQQPRDYDPPYLRASVDSFLNKDFA